VTKQKLLALHARMDACRLCLDADYDVYPRAIYSGVLGARIMTVGQAPGITEKDAGRPFNAGSGTRLFQWLGGAGIDEDWFRSTQYMSSVTKCFPGKAKSGGGDRVPSKQEQVFCRPFLDEEIALVDPELIIPIGNLAIHIFFPGKPKLVDLIGTQKQVDGRWVVPLPHPSGASRWPQIPENKALIEKAVVLIGEHYGRLFNLAKV
jgi:uracil-DNA glycosylase